MDSGTTQDFTVKQSNGQQAYYTLFSANDDAICIAYAYMTWAGEGAGSQYGMVGTFGHQCGVSWYCKSSLYISFVRCDTANT